MEHREFVLTREKRLTPIFDRLLKIIGKDSFDENTKVDFRTAAEAMLDLANESKIVIKADYIITKSTPFLSCEGLGSFSIQSNKIVIINKPLSLWRRIKLSCEVFKNC